MNISCEVIKDLLPLYHDGVCSNESRTMVEEHLKHCESCQAELTAMDAELPIENTERNLKEAEAVQKLSKKWRKGMLKSLLKGALFALIAVAIVFLVLYIFIGFQIV